MNFNELKSSVSLEEPITNKNKKTKDNEKTKPNREGVRQATVRLQAFHYVLSDDSWHFPHKSSSNKIKVNVVHRKQKKEHVTVQSKSFTSRDFQPAHSRLLAHFQKQFDGSKVSQRYCIISAQALMN